MVGGQSVLLVLLAMLTGACAGTPDDGGRPAYRETETVIAILPGHEDTHFGGRAFIALFRDLERSDVGNAMVEVTVWNREGDRGASILGSFDLDAARRLFAGETIDVRNPESGIGYSPPGTESGRGDPSVFGTVVAMQLSLDAATATSTLTMRLGDEREIVVRGQIGVFCSVQDGRTLDDPRWESPFCAEQRASMNVEPFLAAMR
jgi:hypothetical protein